MKGLHKFHNTRQHEGEGLVHFLAKLRSQARFCEFTVQSPSVSCQHVINYSKDLVTGQLITRLANKEQQSKILAEANTLATEEQKFYRLITLETTGTLTPHLKSSLSSHLTFSSLRSEQKCLLQGQKERRPHKLFFVVRVNWQPEDNEENKGKITVIINDNLFCWKVTIFGCIDDKNSRDNWWSSHWSWR